MDRSARLLLLLLSCPPPPCAARGFLETEGGDSVTNNIKTHTHTYIFTHSLSLPIFSHLPSLSPPLFSSSCCCSPHALSDEHRTPSRPKQFGTSSNGSSYFCSFPRRTTEVTLGSRPSRPGGEEEGNILPTVSLPRSSPAAHAPLAEGTYTSA